MRSKLLALLLIVLTQTVLTTGSAVGHQLIKDQSGEVGAILHIQPNDTPKQNEPAIMYFDLQNSSASEINVYVTKGNETKQISDVLLNKSTAEIPYTFKDVGDHQIKFEVKDGNKVYTFIADQYVESSASTQKNTGSYSIVLVIAILMVCLMGLVVFLIRRQNRAL